MVHSPLDGVKVDQCSLHCWVSVEWAKVLIVLASITKMNVMNCKKIRASSMRTDDGQG